MNGLLLEPVVSQILGVMLGIDHQPGVMTIFGLTVVLLAIFLLNKGASIK